MIEVNNKNFEEIVLKSGLPVVIDFFADWCGPCKALAPVLKSISENRDDFKVCKINIEKAKELAIKYGVKSIPYIAVFKDGELIDSTTGFAGRPAIEDLFDRNK